MHTLVLYSHSYMQIFHYYSDNFTLCFFFYLTIKEIEKKTHTYSFYSPKLNSQTKHCSVQEKKGYKLKEKVTKIENLKVCNKYFFCQRLKLQKIKTKLRKTPADTHELWVFDL